MIEWPAYTLTITAWERWIKQATVHLLTTATLNRLRECYPQGHFEVQRFRPNIVVDPVGGAQGFPEQAWIGQRLAIGDEVRLHITGPCGRCVMTTLAQGKLPQDLTFCARQSSRVRAMSGSMRQWCGVA
jgi:uncharacterized protein YcbX